MTTRAKSYKSVKADSAITQLNRFVKAHPGWAVCGATGVRFGSNVGIYTDNKSFYAYGNIYCNSSACDTPNVALTELINNVKLALRRIQVSTGQIWWFKKSNVETTMFHGPEAAGRIEKIHKSKFKFTVRDRNGKEISGYSDTIRAAKSAARNHFKKLMISYAQANT